MTEKQKQSQVRAQKLNIGAIQALERQLMQIQKNRKKALQTVDQDIIDSRKFLDYIQISSGNSITKEEAYPSLFDNMTTDSVMDSSNTRVKPTSSAVLRLEVQLQKALAESRFKDRSKDFFEKWDSVFKTDLQLDSYLIKKKPVE